MHESGYQNQCIIIITTIHANAECKNWYKNVYLHVLCHSVVSLSALVYILLSICSVKPLHALLTSFACVQESV